MADGHVVTGYHAAAKQPTPRVPSSVLACSSAEVPEHKVLAADVHQSLSSSIIHIIQHLSNTQEVTMVAVSLPANFGYSALAWTTGLFITNMFIGGMVMNARKTFNVEYPTLYLGRDDKNAKAFNSVQRGHQNMVESSYICMAMALVGSLHSEDFALYNAVGGVCYSIGCYLYAKGYATAMENGGGRYKQGGAVKYVGVLTGLVTSVYGCLSLTGTI